MLMELNPVLVRHLYGAVRRNTIYWLLALYLILIFAFFLLVSSLTAFGTPSGSLSIRYSSLYDFFTTGRTLFWVSSAVLLFTAWLFAPLPALGMFAGERSNRTLSLLKLTTYPRHAIAAGKMAAALLEGGLFIITPLPIFFYGFWIGGISLVELGLTLLFLLVTFLGSVAVALLISTSAKSTITAVITYYVLAFLSLMVAGTVASGIGILATIPDTQELPFALAALLKAIPILLCSLYPLSAAIATEAYWVDQHRWFLIQVHVPPSSIIYLPSPWIPYTFLVLLLALWAFYATTRSLHRKER